MKKFAAFLAAVTVLLSAAAFAENLSAMTDEELLALHGNVLNEMALRGFPTGGADGTVNRDTIPEPEGYDYDLMIRIADYLADTWADAEPDQAAKEAIITQLTEEHPESEKMIRQIVESFH